MRLRSKPSIVVISFSEFFQFFGRNQIVLCRSFFALHHLFTPSILQATRRMQHVPFWTAKPTHGSNICLCLMKRFLVCNILQKIPKKKKHTLLRTFTNDPDKVHANSCSSGCFHIMDWKERFDFTDPPLAKTKGKKEKENHNPLNPKL